MPRHKTVSFAAWLCLVACSHCSDEVAVIGHFHSVRDASTPSSSRADAGERTTVDARAADGGSAARSNAGSAPPLVGDAFAIDLGARAQFCAGSGSALRVEAIANSTGMGPFCAPSIGRRLFRYGLCACGDLTTSTSMFVSFTLDAFDSRQSAFDKGESGAALGVNGALHLGGLVTVNGTTIVAGGDTLTFTTSLLSNTDLKTNATIEASAQILNVGRDLWSDADIHAGLTSSVARDVYQTPGHAGADTVVSVGGSRQTRSFTVEPPCACGRDRALDIAQIVATAQRANDNGELGLTAAALSDTLQAGNAPAALTCGRFVVHDLSLPAGVLQTLSGRMALFVDGDLTLHGDFASQLAPQAELDVFVSGDLTVAGSAQIGVPARPTAVRLFIAGNAAIAINESVHYAAQIYAPHAPVNITNALPSYTDTYGSILAASLNVSALFTMHYDRAIAELGEHCDGTPPPRCDSCEQCPVGLACIDQTCASCRNDDDCCEPFGCMDGKCQPLIYSPPMK